MHKFVIFSINFLFMFSCHNSKITGENPAKTDFEVLYISEYGGSGEEMTEVISDVGQLNKLWVMITGQSDVPAPLFDADNDMIVRQDFPSQRSGGDKYEITSMEIKNQRIDFYYTVTSPEIGTYAITNPIILIKIPRIENPSIHFNLIRNQ